MLSLFKYIIGKLTAHGRNKADLYPKVTVPALYYTADKRGEEDIRVILLVIVDQ